LTGLPGSAAVEYTGYVDDIRTLVAESRVSVVPLRHGSGTRLKILESLALGTPVVSTTKGAEGLSVTSGEDILLRDDPDGFARGVVELLGSDELHCRLANGGRRLVRSRYDWQVVGADIRTLVQGAASLVGSESGDRHARCQPAEHGRI
jgi:glycosyltransferase involved in cell wall biosynthesis